MGEDAVDPRELGPNAYGLGLVVSAMVVFLLPLAAGISGGYLATHWWNGPTSAYLGPWHTRDVVQMGGLLAGLLIGIGAASVVVHLRQRWQTTGGPNTACPNPTTGRSHDPHAELTHGDHESMNERSPEYIQPSDGGQ